MNLILRNINYIVHVIWFYPKIILRSLFYMHILVCKSLDLPTIYKIVAVIKRLF